jgi:hypothetical protein
MRRTVIAVTAMLCLACTASALAGSVASTSTNNGYTAAFKLTGGVKKNVGVTMTETLGSVPPTSWGRPYPLADILTKVSGIASPYAKYFPKCTVAQINNAGSTGQWNGVCPKGSEVASGTVVSTIGDSTAGDGTTPDPTLTATPLVQTCSLGLHVYYAGGSNLAYFFTVADNACGPLATGAALAYPGTASVKGGLMVNNVPEDANISFNAGGTGDWGSLLSEKLVWNASVKHAGKSYPFLVSTGCTKKKTHTYSAAYIATNATGNSTTAPTTLAPSSTYLPTVTVTGTSKC